MHGSLVDPRLASKFQMPKVRKKPRTHGCSGHSRASQSLCPWQACESRRLNTTCVRRCKPENIALAPAYETLGACTKASSPASSRSDRQTWDMPRLPQVGNFSPSGLCGVLPCPCFECAHVHKRACTKKDTGKDAAEDGHVPHGPSSSGNLTSSEWKSLRKLFSADFTHIAQPVMVRALWNSLK